MDNKNKIIISWVNDYSDYLYNWALYKSSNKEVAEDLVQDTFVIATNSFEKFEGKSSPKTWLVSILNNLIYEHYRKKAKHKNKIDLDISDLFKENGHWDIGEMPSGDFESESLLDDSNFQKVLADCLSKLPDKWNAVIKLKYMTDQKADEICKDLDITKTNYWQMVHRAKIHLRKCVEQNYFNKNK